MKIICNFLCLHFVCLQKKSRKSNQGHLKTSKYFYLKRFLAIFFANNATELQITHIHGFYARWCMVLEKEMRYICITIYDVGFVIDDKTFSVDILMLAVRFSNMMLLWVCSIHVNTLPIILFPINYNLPIVVSFLFSYVCISHIYGHFLFYYMLVIFPIIVILYKYTSLSCWCVL